MQENIKVIKFVFETVQIDFLIEIFSCFFSGWPTMKLNRSLMELKPGNVGGARLARTSIKMHFMNVRQVENISYLIVRYVCIYIS